jgi:hypothetical protein
MPNLIPKERELAITLRNKLGIVGTLWMLLELAIMLTFGAAAQQTPPPQTEGETTEQAFANIKVLQGMPADQLLPTMTLYSTALGVGCPYCHTPPNFSGDEKDLTLTARQMIAMTQALNKASFAGGTPVTCYTCHHGAAIPVGAPAGPSPPRPAASVALPTVDQVLTEYVEALGGEQALRKVITRHISGTREVQGQLPQQFERFEKAPNLSLVGYEAVASRNGRQCV